MGDREPTLGEVSEKVDDLIEAVRDFPKAMAETYVRRDVYEIQVGQLTTEVAELKEGNKWRNRMIAASVLMPILLLIVWAFVTSQVTRAAGP